MARPSKKGGKTSAAKTRGSRLVKGRKSGKTKRRLASTASRSGRSSRSGLGKALKEARDQQAATAEILKVINASPGDLTPVFDIILEKAHGLCDVPCGSLQLFDDAYTRAVAVRGMTEPFEKFLRRGYRLDQNQPVQSLRPFQIDDLAKVATDGSALQAAFELGDLRTMLSVPLVRSGVAFGRIVAGRQQVRPFSEHQIALLQSFADQAVIAIENARLFNETQEALARQDATAEVLKIVASSPSDVKPVFNAIVRTVLQVLKCDRAFIMRCEAGSYFPVARATLDGSFVELTTGSQPIDPAANFPSRAIVTRKTVYYPDRSVIELPEYERFINEEFGVKSSVFLPLLRQEDCIGVLALASKNSHAFSATDIALAEAFRDQALIAIENARLFNETKEALARQTATSDVLRVIGSSPGELQPVFDAMLENATRICAAKCGILYRCAGDALRTVATHGAPRTFVEERQRNPIVRPDPETTLGRALSTKHPVQIADILAEIDDLDGRAANLPKLAGARTVLAVPMVKGNELLGAILIYRQEVRPFTDKEIELVKNFAAQSVIAIENTRLLNELRESLQQQTATADVLKVISRSTFDLQKVLNTLAESVCRLCEAYDAIILLCEGDYLHIAAHFGEIPVVDKWPISRDWVSGRCVVDRKPIYVHDLMAEEAEYPRAHAFAQRTGHRTLFAVPLLRDQEVIGAINIRRTEVRPFTDKQIELVSTFADQAVIAIENVRLFDEVQAKTRDLEEALRYQTGSANILNVIASSPTDVQPVLEAIVKSACDVCDGYDAAVHLRDGSDLLFSAHHGPIPFAWEAGKRPISRHWTVGRAVLDKQPVMVSDFRGPKGDDFPEGREMSCRQGHRCTLSVPLLREGEAIGAIALRRMEPVAFNEKQIALLQTFANQAVIAIENARLFNETQEALKQQTATGDVLKIISRSSVDLKTVLDTLVETVASLCNADQAVMWRRRDDLYHVVAWYGLSEEAKEFVRAHPVVSGRGTVSGRAALEGRPIHVSDVLEDPEYTYKDAQKLAGYRSLLSIPLLREDALIGIFSIHRTRVDPFTSKEIELASSFADQAVIAIENARLFEELRERQAELRVTFDNMGDGVVMFGADTRLVAWNRNFQCILDLPDEVVAQRPTYGEYVRVLAERGEFGTNDIEAELSRRLEDTDSELRLERSRPDGHVIEVRRNTVPGGGFVLIYSDVTERKHAEQAVRAARDAAEKSLRELQTAQDRLVQTQKLASLGQLTAGIAHEIKNPLNFINNFSALSSELTDELNSLLVKERLSAEGRLEVSDLTRLLKDNLDKIVQHGRRADSIVKNMLLHSREGVGEHRPVEINAIVDESLNLAYHGARAEKPGFNIMLERDFDPTVGVADIHPQEVTRVLLNLISNGFYAATQRAAAGNGFEPKLEAMTRNLGDKVEIRIRDNGMGIPPDIREKIFNPFFTTKPAGEGTGLGLSMSHDIVVKQHGGTIEVVTEPGTFTEFIITLPRILP
jgi:GAF domain-containing protein/signal transduction histidine kinase